MVTHVLVCEQDSSSPKRLFMFSIAVPALAIALSNTAVNLLLIEIASTFHVNEGVAAQIRTANAVGEFVFALLAGFFASRFRPKSMILAGLLLTTISAVGSFVAPNLPAMLLFSFMEGSGTVITFVMILTIVGDTLHLSRKAKAVSLITAAGFISTLAGTPLISFIAAVESWRYIFLLLVFPVSIAALALVFLGVPSTKPKPRQHTKKTATWLHDFKLIFSNKSAASCLMASLFFTGIETAVFRITFFRQQFLLSLEQIVYFTLVTAVVLIAGTVVTGRFGNKFGTKFLSTTGIFGSGIFAILMFLATDLWVALIFSFLQSLFTAIALSAFPCLALDQVKSLRGLMMSMTKFFSNIGRIVAPAVSGFLFALLYSPSGGAAYAAVGLTFGFMNIAAAMLCFLTKDPQSIGPD